jgi:UDP-N-acetylmuramoyl-tripeptide--D-alanyl-D-alanine ligase
MTVGRMRTPLVLTAGAIAAAVGGHVLFGDAAQIVDGFSIDSRTLRRGDLFIALRGDRFDGAAYAARSLEAGACGVMIARESSHTARRPEPAHGERVLVIEVDDTTEALQALGKHVRLASGARVTAITGSAGKTTTKEITAAFLSARYNVYRNPGNFNNHIGLPLSLLELRARPDVAVVELGMNHAGEISRLVALAEPDVRVWTNVGDAHLGFFSSPDAIADAKAEIFEGATPSTVLVANADDARVMARVPAFAGRVVTFGTSQRAEIRATQVEELGVEGTRAHVRTPEGEAHLRVPLLGIGNLQNVLAATAVAHVHGVPLDDVVECAAAVRPARHRGEIVRLRAGVTLVDDSYNSSPAALMRTLEAVGRDRSHERKTAVLGEMLELGAFAEPLHVECGHAAVKAGISRLVAVGGAAAAALAGAARDAGLDDGAAVHVATSAEAADVLLASMAPGDLVLVKGSRGIGTDLVVERLKAEWS